MEINKINIVALMAFIDKAAVCVPTTVRETTQMMPVVQMLAAIIQGTHKITVEPTRFDGEDVGSDKVQDQERV